MLCEKIRRHPKITTGLVVASLGGAGLIGGNILADSGDVQVVRGYEQRSKMIDAPVIISANARGELTKNISKLKAEVRAKSATIVVMQEVEYDSFDNLHAAFSTWDKAFVYGDRRQKALAGGLGNVILSRTRLENVKGQSLNQPRFVENRAILSAKTKLIVEGQEQEIQIATAHIGRQSQLNEVQRGQVMNDLEDIASEADSTIFCGDLNIGTFTAMREFNDIEYNTMPAPNNTYVGLKEDKSKGSIVDHCAFYEAGNVGFEKVSVGKKFVDHRFLEVFLTKLEEPVS